jgi:hypothetical protein
MACIVLGMIKFKLLSMLGKTYRFLQAWLTSQPHHSTSLPINVGVWDKVCFDPITVLILLRSLFYIPWYFVNLFASIASWWLKYIRGVYF